MVLLQHTISVRLIVFTVRSAPDFSLGNLNLGLGPQPWRTPWPVPDLP